MAAITGNSTIDDKRGFDVDALLGYDFGFFRLEGEVAHKRANLDTFEQDSAFGTGVTTALAPAGTTGATFTFPTGDADSFNLGRRVSVLSGMVNALLDLDIGGGALYGGGGFGRARVKAFNDSDTVWAYQGIAGFRVPVSDNIDVGVKYRYFRTRGLDLAPAAASFSSTRTVAVPNTDLPDGTAAVGSTDVSFTGNASVVGDFNDRFSSHSVLLSLAFNFGGRGAAPLPPPPPPPQTCPDGSVVLATEVCPLPPPPAPERG